MSVEFSELLSVNIFKFVNKRVVEWNEFVATSRQAMSSHSSCDEI